MLGAPLVLDSVRVKEVDEDITPEVGPAFERMKLVLAKSVRIEACQPLLR